MILPCARNPGLLLCLVAMAVVPGCFRASAGVEWNERVRREWLEAEEIAAVVSANVKPVQPADDAAGGCDGIINGDYGFHTPLMENPWWQVDLGQELPLDRVVIWNRTLLPERAAHIEIQLSADGKSFRKVHQNPGTVFLGFNDNAPLAVGLKGASARFVRLALPGTVYLHLDEVQVFGLDSQQNLALHRPANQSGVSEWSRTIKGSGAVDWRISAEASIVACSKLLGDTPGSAQEIEALRQRLAKAPDEAAVKEVFLAARKRQRKISFQNPLLRGFDALLFTKRVHGSFNHMSDQYYGWWSKPGGGIYLLRDFLSETPREQCITTAFKEPGSFLRPALSPDGQKVLFAWCQYHPGLAEEPNKLDKSRVPENAFYHLFEMNLDGSGLRQLTRGKYDDFDGRYLPDGRIVFLSTRRGQSLQAGTRSAAETMRRPDMPDSYVRCGGGPERPVAVYTLHTMNPDGGDITAISPFEMFEWTPEIAHDGTILHSRWDYIDRDNMPFMGLWAINPDGSSPRSVFKNYTSSPHCTFEARPIPGSTKIVFTASAHHSQTMGSLVLLDPSAGIDGQSPMTRLTPEVPFPEVEGWPLTYYLNPFPLSERHYLVAWGAEGLRVPGPQGWSRWHAVQRPAAGTAIYAYDAALRTRELLWSDSSIACGDPIPIRSVLKPQSAVLTSRSRANAPSEGQFLVSDVYRGLTNVQRGRIKSLRIVAVPPKTHPTMNFPAMGITRDDPGKCVLGTVPVEPDGSAFFRVPAGVIVFFQALDSEGIALQTMRSVTHVQPGQTLSCIGCHENRGEAPASKSLLAMGRPPSPILPGPEGSWPLRFDRLVQPVLNARCISCHSPGSTNLVAARLDLSASKAYETLVEAGSPSLQGQVQEAYRRGISLPGEGISQRSRLWNMLAAGHQGIHLDAGEKECILTWLDTYAQRLGSFSAEQERELDQFRKASGGLLSNR